MKSVAAYRSGHNADAERNQAAQNIDGIFSRINLACEAYPDLKAQAVIADAMRQNSYLQKEVTAARTLYNDTVGMWNQDIFAWPTKQIVAARAGYTTRIPFTASAETKAAARSVFFLIDGHFHEPLEQFSSHFKTAHVNNTSDFFEDLVRRSGVDENANIKTVQELRELEKRAAGAGSTNKLWRILRGIAIAAALLTALYVYAHYAWPWLVAPAIVFAAAIYMLTRRPSPSWKTAYSTNGARIAPSRSWKQNPAMSGEGRSFTVMANREFDALFDATDRNHEVQFRLLFTPLAQQEMLKLLKDSETGFGDTFVFEKTHMINVVQSRHMRHTDISGDPEKFLAYELAQARMFFNGYHNDFFRSFYFGIAPLLAIPLYQQHRPHSDIYKDTYSHKPCFWEHEAIANHHGEAMFNHPECVTRSILKTSTQHEADGSQTVHVTASGFRSVERIHHVSVRGGDGRSHQVPVHWNEYFGVQNSANMLVKETTSPGELPGEAATASNELALPASFSQRGIDLRQAVLRRSIVSAVVPA